MEALRNYVQHRGIPIHLTTYQYQSRWQDGPDHRYMEFSIRLVATREKLREDGRFKANILAEMPLEVEIPHALRQYVEAISEIHCFARGTIQAEVVGAKRLCRIPACKVCAALRQESCYPVGDRVR